MGAKPSKHKAEVTDILRLHRHSCETYYLDKYPAIKTLIADDIGSQGFAKLSKSLADGACTCLRRLILPRNHIGDKGIIGLSKAFRLPCLSELEELDLQGNAMTDIGMKALMSCFVGHCKNLSSLNLQNNKLNSTAIQSLSIALIEGAFKKLSVLELGMNRFNDGGLQQIVKAIHSGSLVELKKLDISFNRIHDKAFRELIKVYTNLRLGLEHLEFGGNIISHSCIEWLVSGLKKGGFPSLLILGVPWNHVGDKALAALGMGIKDSQILPHLQELNLERTDFRYSGYSVLFSAISDLHELKSLILDDNYVGDTGIVELSKALYRGKNPNLSSLSMRKCNVSSDGFITFCSVLETGVIPLVKTLNFSQNFLDDNGVLVLQEVLLRVKFECLTTLVFNHNSISSRGTELLSSSKLKATCPFLTDIFLMNNR